MKKEMCKRGLAAGIVLLCTGALLWQGSMQKQHTKDEIIFIDESEYCVPMEGMMNQNYMVLGEVLTNVPQRITDKMYSDGWKYTITEDNLSEMYFQGMYSSVMAVTDSNIKTIWLSANERAIRESAIHELGHYIEYSKNYPNKSEEFMAIYEAEKSSFVVVNGNPTQARSSSLEYFAEAFQETVLHPESMQQHTPRTYQYMRNMIDSF